MPLTSRGSDGYIDGKLIDPVTNTGIYEFQTVFTDVPTPCLSCVTGSPLLEASPAICAAHSGGVNSQRSMIVWDTASATQYDIGGAIYDLPAGGLVTSFCAGLPEVCPCANGGSGGAGCASSVNPAGGLLAAFGAARVSADTFRLNGSGMPSSACLYFQGFDSGSLTFGDGVRCVAGPVIRLGTKMNAAGSSSYPALGDESVSVRGQVPAAGALRHYQARYRNAASFCSASTFNLTNALGVVWIP